jgi:hypothetical protein
MNPGNSKLAVLAQEQRGRGGMSWNRLPEISTEPPEILKRKKILLPRKLCRKKNLA